MMPSRVMTSADLDAAGWSDLFSDGLAEKGLASTIAPSSHVVAFDGHSFAAYEWSPANRRKNNGIGYWVEALSCGAVKVPYTRNYGAAGETSTQIAARVATTVAGMADCGAIVLTAPQINDRGSAALTEAETKASIGTILTALLATGKPIFYVATTPRLASGSGAMSGTQATNLLNVLSWERSYVADLAPGQLFLIDVYDQFADTDGLSPITGATLDGVHPSPTMASAIGSKIAAILRSMYPSRDPIARVLTGRTNLVTNVNLTGSGGSSSGSGSISGNVPTNTTITKPGSHAVTVGQKVVGDRYMYEVGVVYSGSGFNNGPEFVMAIGAIADGDIVQFGGELEVEAPTGGCCDVYIGLRIGTSGTTFIGADGYRYNDTTFLPGRRFRIPIVSEPITISGLGASTPNLILRTNFGAAGSVKYRIERPFLVKIT